MITPENLYSNRVGNIPKSKHIMYNYIMQPYLPQNGRAPGGGPAQGPTNATRGPGPQIDDPASSKNFGSGKADKQEMSFGLGLGFDQKMGSEAHKTPIKKSSHSQGFSGNNLPESQDSNSVSESPAHPKNTQNHDGGENMLEQVGFNRTQLRISMPSLDIGGNLGKSSVPKVLFLKFYGKKQN